MKLKASLVVMSHLSDVQEALNFLGPKDSKNMIRDEINFCKYIILKCKGDLNQDIDPDQMYEDYSFKK